MKIKILIFIIQVQISEFHPWAPKWLKPVLEKLQEHTLAMVTLYIAVNCVLSYREILGLQNCDL